MKKQLNDSRRIFGLDLMRATAILMVLSSHCLWIYPESNSFLFQLLKLFGFLGVEIFFVLSGFLIGKILIKTFSKPDFSFSDVKVFLKRRWFRTLPNYFLVLIVNIIIAGIIGYEIESLWKYFFFLQNFSKPMLAFFPESWSLSVEEWAYFLLPFLLFFVVRIFKVTNKSKLFLITVIVLLAVFLFFKISYHIYTSNTTLNQWNISLKAVVIYRLDSILYGVLASWIYCNYPNFWKKHTVSALAIGCFGLLFVFFVIGKLSLPEATLDAFLNTIYLPIVSILISLFLPFLSQWKQEKSFFKKPIVFISLISYSIYLLHYSVILQLMKHFVSVDDLSQNEHYLFTFIYLFVTILLSLFLYLFFEKPIMDLREKVKKQL